MNVAFYVIKRVLFVIPTLIGITIVTFALINLAPGGPVEQKIRAIRFGGTTTGSVAAMSARGQVGVSQEVVDALKKQYGLDKPLWQRYVLWVKKTATFDFGNSFIYQQPALNVIKDRLPVSLAFGLVSLVLTYLVSIPLGLLMAKYEGRTVDTFLTLGLMGGSAMPAFAFAIILIVFFAGGQFLQWFPVAYLQSDNYSSLSALGKIADRLHHFVLPTLCYMIGSFTGVALLARNTVLEELQKDYITVVRAKGFGERAIYFKHALRNALIPLVTGIGGILAMFLGGSIVVENVFQIDGMGQLGYQAVLSRDYNLIMALAFIQSLLLLVGTLISDLAYMIVDPRVDLA